MFRQQKSNLLVLSRVSQHFLRSPLCHSLSNPGFSYLTSPCVFVTCRSPKVWICLCNDTLFPTSSISLLFCWMALSRATIWLAVEGSSPSLFRSLSLLLVPLWSLFLLWFLLLWAAYKGKQERQRESWTIVIRQLAKNTAANSDDD